MLWGMLLTGLIVVAVLLFGAGAYCLLRERFAWGCGLWAAGLLAMAAVGCNWQKKRRIR
jgi:hypothetical protein